MTVDSKYLACRVRARISVDMQLTGVEAQSVNYSERLPRYRKRAAGTLRSSRA